MVSRANKIKHKKGFTQKIRQFIIVARKIMLIKEKHPDAQSIFLRVSNGFIPK